MANRLLTLSRRSTSSRRTRREKRHLERWLKARATTIRRQARRGGWSRENRRARYRAIRAVLRVT